MIYTKHITVPRPEADYATKVCAKPPGLDLVDPDSTVFSWTAIFDDGMTIDVKVCADSEPTEHTCWCEAVLFAPGENGDLHEVSCSEVEERPWGEWGFKHEGNEYLVVVDVKS